MKLKINHHTHELLLTAEQCFAFFKLQTVQDLVVYLQAICNVAEEIKTLSIDDQEIDVSDEGLQLPLKQVQSLLPLLTIRELQRLPVELVSQVLSYTDAKTVRALLSLPSRLKPSAMNNHFRSELGKQILTAQFQVDESLWKAFERYTPKGQAAGKDGAFATWFQSESLKSFLALINVKNQTPPSINDGFFLSWVTNFGPSVMAAYKDTADATMEQKILYALVAPINLIDPEIITEILTAENSAVANYLSLLESLRLTLKIMQVKNNLTEMDQVKSTLSDRQFTYINFASMDLRGAYLRGANLSGTNLSDANLSDLNLSWADLNSANLSGAKLSGAELTHATLVTANLSDANLQHANLYCATLNGANLQHANLQRTKFNRANLSGANLQRTNLNKTDLSNAILAGVQMDFSVFNNLPISVLNNIQIRTLAFLSQQIVQTKTLTEVEAIMQNNQNGILYLAHKSQPVVTPVIGTFFPSNTAELPNSAREFEVAIAARKAELQDELQSQASSSVAPKF